MTSAPREGAVLDAVATVVDSMLDDFDVVDLLTLLTERCAALLDVASAGLLLAGPDDQLHLMAATSQRTEALELFQLQADEGPCLECYSTGSPVSAADLSRMSDRWPRFVVAATDSGFRSVHALPMRAAGVVIGALGLFGTETGELGDDDRLLAQTLAHLATVAILQEGSPSPATLGIRLRSALSRRVVVEQAKGFLFERLEVSTDDAFALLRRYADGHRLRLSDVARELLVEGDRQAEIVQGLREILGHAG